MAIGGKNNNETTNKNILKGLGKKIYKHQETAKIYKIQILLPPVVQKM